MEMDYENRVVSTEYLPEDEGDNPLRPKTLKEYIGQTKVKENLSVQRFQLKGCIYIKYKYAARLNEEPQPIKHPADILFRYVINAVKRAHGGLNSTVEVQFLHLLAYA